MLRVVGKEPSIDWTADGVYWVPANGDDIDPTTEMSILYDNPTGTSSSGRTSSSTSPRARHHHLGRPQRVPAPPHRRRMADRRRAVDRPRRQ